MDRIHEIDKKPWICKREINLKKLMEQRGLDLQRNNVTLNKQCDAKRDTEANLEVEDPRVIELKDELERFMSHNEKEVKPYFLFNSTDERTLTDEPKCKLKLCRLQLEHAKKMISDRNYKVSYLTKLRSTRRELLMRQLAQTNRSNTESETVEDTELITYRDPGSEQPDLCAIVVIQIWPQPGKTTKVRLEKEILFRGDHCLTELRDLIKCQRDYGVPIDLSENPEQAERIYRGELFKSGFFLIGDTFYNDMRDQNNKDLSADIVDWALKEVTTIGEDGENLRVTRGIGPFNRRRMEDCKFEDLNFRLGCPYLYLHQGDCEHLFTISDVRYVPHDVHLELLRFPYVTATTIAKKVDHLRCYMCKHRPPHWYTRNNTRLPVDPYFFCENCYYSFNYDKDKKKIGHFQAYEYTSTFGIPERVVMATNNRR